MLHAELPSAGELAHTYTELVRRQVTAKAAPIWLLGAKPQIYVGIYEDSARGLEGLWVADVPLAATLGAVLTLIPPAVAQEASRKGQLSPELLEGVQEIANITANNFHDKRVRLASFLAPGAALPPGPAALLSKPGRRLDVRMEVAGYPGGRLLMLGA